MGHPASVAQNGHGGVAAVDGDDAATGVRAGPAEINTGHGGFCGEAAAPHVGGQAFSLEDVAAGEADFLLDVRRAEHLHVDDSGGEVGTEAAERGEREVADGGAMVVPGAGSEGMRDVLREDAHGVQTGWSDDRVMHALEIELAPELLRQIAATGCGEALPPFGMGERRVDLAVVMRLIKAGAGDEVWQLL